ncbi:MAG: hypothetical protein J5379_04980 [Clostridiales bacterium]|nr:hypothetical protein [Clostridiales bacterium]
MIKRVFATLLTIVMTTSMLCFLGSGKVEAAAVYNLWVSGIQVNSANQNDILGDGTGSAKFDPSTNTLTLNQPEVKDGQHASGAQICSVGIDLKITGEATLDTGEPFAIYCMEGQDAQSNKIGGNLFLVDTAIVAKGAETAIKADRDINITGGTVTAEGGTKNGLHAVKGNIYIDGNVYAKGKECSILALGTPSGVEIYGGTVIADGTVAAYAHILIDGGDVRVFNADYALNSTGFIKIGDKVDKVELDAATAAFKTSYVITISSNAKIYEPQGAYLSSDKKKLLGSDGNEAKYVRFVPKMVIFTWRSGEGEGSDITDLIEYGKKKSIRSYPDPWTVPEGMHFDGWWAEGYFGKDYFNGDANSDLKILADGYVVFTAIYKNWITGWEDTGDNGVLDDKAVGGARVINKTNGDYAITPGDKDFFDIYLKDGFVLQGSIVEVIGVDGEVLMTIPMTYQESSNRYYGEITMPNQDVTLRFATRDNCPVITKAEPNDTGVQLKWKETEGFSRYNVYRSESETGTYTYLASVIDATKYADTTAQSGKTYYYKVRPYRKDGGSTVYGVMSAPKKVVILEDTKLTAEPKSGVTMRLNWTEVNGAQVYEIYRATSAAGPYTYVKATTGTSTSDTGLVAGTRYYYMVRAKSTVNGEVSYSKYAGAVSVALATPTLESAAYGVGKGVTLKWTKASGADRYNVYKYNTKSGKYEYVTSVLGGTLMYTDPVGKKGDYYKVRAYKRVGGVVYYGGWSNAKAGK